jgi:hypothetical protein
MQKHNSITKHNQLFVAKKNERNDNEHGQMPSGSKAWSLRLRLEKRLRSLRLRLEQRLRLGKA